MRGCKKKMENEEIKEKLGQQLELLSEKSKNAQNAELCALTEAMAKIISLLVMFQS